MRRKKLGNFNFLTTEQNLQETWVVKLTPELEHDGWGQDFLHLMKKFEVELQRLTAYIHGYIMAPNYTISGINGHLCQIDITQWERTAIQFVHLFLFLFDVDITLERGTDYENPQFQESETFSHDSVYRSRILSKIHFIRYLEVCAWKVLTL